MHFYCSRELFTAGLVVTTYAIGVGNSGAQAQAAPESPMAPSIPTITQPHPQQAAALGQTQPATLSDFAIAADPAPDSPAESSQPTMPSISARFGGKFTSGPGAGYESSFGSVSGFVPLTQTAGKALLFTEGRLNIATAEGNLGGNLRLGYRTLLPENNLVVGGYLGYDIRDTGNTTFHQLGAGLEALANGWEARLNGYLPVGDRRNLVHEQTFDTGNVFSNLRFTGNFLAATRTRLQVIDRSFEASMAGFDLEGGVKLLSWNSGNLKAFAGMYLYSAPEMNTFAGFRTRLQADITQNVAAGLALETDGNYGTRLIASVGVSFGGAPVQRQPETPAESIAARLGLPVARQENIAVDQQRELQQLSEQEDITLTNPVTGQPWRFVHVTPGAAGGTGTVEAPLGEIAGNGVNNAFTDGNNIIYVQGAGTVAGNFTIPDNVQLLSAAVPQLINTVQLNTLQLPGSGTGVYPGINNTVRLGNNTVISGFAITPPAGNTGILANGVRTVTIRENQVQASGDDTPGIRLQNVTGTATVNNNTVATTGNSIAFPLGSYAIFVDLNGTALDTLTLTNNRLTTTRDEADGIVVYPDNNSTIATATLLGNTINTTGDEADGIVFELFDNSTITTATLSGNTINTTGDEAEGIFVRSQTNSTIATATLSGNTINTTGDGADGVYVSPDNNSTITTVTLSGNTITTTGEDAEGIYVNPQTNSTITTATLSGNTITTTGEFADGIHLYIDDNSTITTATLSGNTITTTGDFFAQGIYISPENNSTIATATLSGNTITTTGVDARGIVVASNDNSTITTATLSGNTITTTGDDAFGIFVSTANNSAIATATLSGNTITASGTGSNGMLLQFGQLATAPLQITIANNTLKQTGDRGISLETFGATQATATITNNTVTNASGTGINVVANDTSQLRTIIDSNQVSNVQLLGVEQVGISVATVNTAQLFGSITNNRVANTNAIVNNNRVEYRAQTNPPGVNNICVRFQNNSASLSGYWLANLGAVGSTIRIEPFTGNTGGTAPQPATSGTLANITNAVAGACGF